MPPERLLKASLFISLYLVHSERAFCEELEYKLLVRWFLDMNLMERSFDPTVFTKSRWRLSEHRTAQALFDEVVWEAGCRGLLSDERLSVDGILIEGLQPGANGQPAVVTGDPDSSVGVTCPWRSRPQMA